MLRQTKIIKQQPEGRVLGWESQPVVTATYNVSTYNLCQKDKQNSVHPLSIINSFSTKCHRYRRNQKLSLWMKSVIAFSLNLWKIVGHPELFFFKSCLFANSAFKQTFIRPSYQTLTCSPSICQNYLFFQGAQNNCFLCLVLLHSIQIIYFCHLAKLLIENRKWTWLKSNYYIF